MSFPVKVGVGDFVLSLHLIFEILAFTVGFRYFLYLRKRSSDIIPEGNRVWIIIGAAFGAFFFSRMVGALEDPVRLVNTNNILLYWYSNKTIVGGLLGGLLGVEITKKLIGESHSSGDLFTYPLILAIILGRIGCFSSGVYEQTYGEETSLFTGMDLGDGLRRHPAALYEIIFLIIVWTGLVIIEKQYKFSNGTRFQMFMIGYLSFRFLLDFIKPGYTYFWGIGTIQLCCLAGLFYYRKTIIKILLHPTQLIYHA